MGDYFSKVWGDFLDFLAEHQNSLFMSPIFWIIIVLLIIGLYGLFDVPGKTSQNSLGNVIRRLMQVLLDTSADLIDSLGSLTGFLSVVRMLLFGKLNSRTLFVLINYAIIFLSMASFATTFTGLQVLVSWPLAAFISFGVQVSILIYSMRILKHRNKFHQYKKRRKYIKEHEIGNDITIEEIKKAIKGTKNKVKIIYRFDDNIQYKYLKKGKLNIEEVQQKNGSEYESKPEPESESPEIPSKKYSTKDLKKYYGRRMFGRGVLIGLIGVLLLGSLIMSSSFSYLYMFEKFVNNQLPFDDYYRSIEIVHDVIIDYSRELDDYESKVTEVLSTYNNNVAQWLELQANDPREVQERYEIAEAEYQAASRELDELQSRLETEGDDNGEDTEEYRELSAQVGAQETEVNRLRSIYSDLEDDIDSDNFRRRLTAARCIEVLTRFYVNPLYMQDLDGQELINTFSSLLQSEREYQDEVDHTPEHAVFEDTDRDAVRGAFEVYYQLCLYYNEHGGTGLDFSIVQDALKINPDKMEEDAALDTAEEDVEDEKAKRNRAFRSATEDILSAMLQEMNAIPILPELHNMWKEETISAPDQADYLNQIYSLYRDSSGTVTSFERALSKLFHFNRERTKLARELAVLALTIDVTIVWLTLLRGKKQWTSNISDLRRLIGVLMLDDTFEQENNKYRKGQSFCLAMGIAGGVLLFLLGEFNNSYSVMNNQGHLLMLLFFCLLGLSVGLLLFRMYCKVVRCKKRWDEETLYLIWKKIWQDSNKTEKELLDRINRWRNGEELESFNLDKNSIQHMVDTYQNKDNQQTFTKYFYNNVLNMFDALQMKTLHKIIINKQIEKRQIVSGKYISEEIVLPCINECVITRNKLQPQFSILLSRHLIDHDKGMYILTERFWGLLYDAVLLCIAGGRISEHDIEEDLLDYAEEEEDIY